VLDRLTATDFASAVGDIFVLDAGDAGALDLELVEARLHDPDAPAKDASGARAPFSLVFRGPVDPVLPQRIYRLEHESLAPMEIFIVPVARDQAGTSYEAVFA
jgi:uncharacterized protein DUF6916